MRRMEELRQLAHEGTGAQPVILKGCELEYLVGRIDALREIKDSEYLRASSAEAELITLRKRLAEMEATLSFCADHVTNIRATSDGYEVRLVEENPLEALRGGHWYTGATLEAAIAAARGASDNESEAR